MIEVQRHMVDAHAFPGFTSDVVPEIDIWRTANLMIRRYGGTADLEACLRADELSAKGDRAGMLVWLRILAAIDSLQNVKPNERKN